MMGLARRKLLPPHHPPRAAPREDARATSSSSSSSSSTGASATAHPDALPTPLSWQRVVRARAAEASSSVVDDGGGGARARDDDATTLLRPFWGAEVMTDSLARHALHSYDLHTSVVVSPLPDWRWRLEGAWASTLFSAPLLAAGVVEDQGRARRRGHEDEDGAGRGCRPADGDAPRGPGRFEYAPARSVEEGVARAARTFHAVDDDGCREIEEQLEELQRDVMATPVGDAVDPAHLYVIVGRPARPTALLLSSAHYVLDARGAMRVLELLLAHAVVDETEPTSLAWGQEAANLPPSPSDAVRRALVTDGDGGRGDAKSANGNNVSRRDANGTEGTAAAAAAAAAGTATRVDEATVEERVDDVVRALPETMSMPTIPPQRAAPQRLGVTSRVVVKLDAASTSALQSACRALGSTVSVAVDVAVRLGIAAQASEASAGGDRKRASKFVAFPTLVDMRRWFPPELRRSYAGCALTAFPSSIPLDDDDDDDEGQHGVDDQEGAKPRRRFAKLVRHLGAQYRAWLRDASLGVGADELWRRAGFGGAEIPQISAPNAHALSSLGVLEEQMQTSWRTRPKDNAASVVVELQSFATALRIVWPSFLIHFWTFKGELHLQGCYPDYYDAHVVQRLLDDVAGLLRTL